MRNKQKIMLDPITQSGNITFTSTITDSRGRSTSDSKSITVYKYVNPAFSAVEYKRGTYTDDAWTDSDGGNDIKITLTPTIALPGNTGGVSFKINNNTIAPTYGTPTELTNGTQYVFFFKDITNEVTYNLEVILTDSVGTTASAKLTIPTINVTMDFHNRGTGIAFGKVSEYENCFDCAWDMRLKGAPVADFLVEQGTSGIWTYQKWNSGIAECWGEYSGSVSVSNHLSSAYHSNSITVNYPISFAEPAIFTVDGGSNDKINWARKFAENRTDHATFLIIALEQQSSAQIRVNLHVCGRWK